MSEFTPVETAKDLESLDDDEIPVPACVAHQSPAATKAAATGTDGATDRQMAGIASTTIAKASLLKNCTGRLAAWG